MNVIDGVVMTFVDISERKQQADHVVFIMRETSHRNNNLLAIIQAMAQQTGRHSSNYRDFTARFNERLQGLAASNQLLVRQDWKGTPLDDLVRAQVKPFIESDLNSLEVGGPAVMLTPAAVQSIGLALHELATNASKYGALSNPGGKVEVRWEFYDGKSERCIRLTWRKCGGPPVVPPGRRGFGSTVLEQMTRQTLSAETKAEYLSEGVVWTFACPTSRVLEKPER